MDRLACVDVAAFPLQLLLCEHPDWAAQPVAVVEDDRPQSSVLFTNVHARKLGVRIGQRYASALALARNLHAGAVSPSQIDRGVRMIADRLRRYSPHVEPSSDIPGVFWIDASGLRHLYPSLRAWADLIRVDLEQEGMIASIAVGFSRFGAYALAISQRGTVMCADATEERTRVQRVPLAWLNLEPDARDRLLALGIETVGDFLRLPGNGIRTRFGAAAETLHQLAAGTRWSPIVPVPAEVRHQRFVAFDAPESSIERLLFVIKRRLDSLATIVSRQGEAIVEVVLWMKLDDRTTRIESVKPAASTLDVAQLLTLLRLRLEALQLSSGIVTLRVSVDTCVTTSDQRGLLPEQTLRDADAANRALARIRAECGDQSVVHAAIRDAHLPSARFAWEPMTHVPAQASPRVVTSRPLVRRILTAAVPLPMGFQISEGASGIHPAIWEECRASGLRGDGARNWHFVRAACELTPSRDSAMGGDRADMPALPSRQFQTDAHRTAPSRPGPTTFPDGGMNAPVALPVAEHASAAGSQKSSFAKATVDKPSPELHGPYVLSGGWWGGGVRRDYYFVRVAHGELWWIYFDHRRQQFFLQGKVE